MSKTRQQIVILDVKVPAPDCTVYILNCVWGNSVTTYTFEDNKCKSGLLEQIEEAHRNETCPPFWDGEEVDSEGKKTEVFRDIQGKVLMYGPIEHIDGLTTDDVFFPKVCTEIRVYTFYMDNFSV